MADYETWESPALLRTGAAGLLACAVLAGCGRQDAKTPVTDAGPATNTAAHNEVVKVAKAETLMHQTFAEATLDNIGEQYLPATTMTGKSVGILYEQVKKRWDQISFLTAKGEKLGYSAMLDTELGPIEIDLLPELAPNHVRSFIALAQSGYYDGLVFERVISEQSDDDPNTKVELIEGGCPVGLGNPGYGSIGYWLKPEFNPDVHHEEGMVGACHGEDEGSAACRFYVTMSKAPVMDGKWTIFGKVTRGMDVVRRISTQPLLNTPDFPLGDRPEKPVVIRKVTIKGNSGTAVVAREGDRKDVNK